MNILKDYEIERIVKDGNLQFIEWEPTKAINK
jgi:hypothetical protein